MRGATHIHVVLFERFQISIHAPLAGCDERHERSEDEVLHFNPRTPCGVRLQVRPCSFPDCHFNPRTPCGVRLHLHYLACGYFHFNPRTPCGVRRPAPDTPRCASEFQSTHPLRGATLVFFHFVREKNISIHAPLAGCDAVHREIERDRQISIHAPLAGCDICRVSLAVLILYFNPRTPCGVRLCADAEQLARMYISIHAPLAGCDEKEFEMRTEAKISIHAPLAGCDSTVTTWRFMCFQFQSTHPLRGATLDNLRYEVFAEISIHAPLAGCDLYAGIIALWLYISIHAPLAGCDARRAARSVTRTAFQSTHPLRGATSPPAHGALFVDISIHAPLAGCDLMWTIASKKN